MISKKSLRIPLISLSAIALSFSLFTTLYPSDSRAAANYDFSVDGFLYSFISKYNHSHGVILNGYAGNNYTDSVLYVEGNVYYDGETMRIVKIKEEAFKDNPYINTLYLSEGLADIGKSAFQGCSNLTEIKFPTSLETICDRAFMDCGQLTEVDLSNTNLITTDTSILVHEKAKNTAVFSGCSKIKSVKLPTNEEFRILPAEWFKDCTELTTVTIPGNIWEIDAGCFQGDAKLADLKFSNGLMLLDDKAFKECSSISTVNVPSTVMVLGKEAFYKCSALDEFNIPSGTNINVLEDACFKGTALKQFVIPSSATLKTVESEAFAGCEALTKVEIQTNSVEWFGAKAFADCPVLTDITIPKTLKTIGVQCFENDVLLSDIKLNDSLSSLGRSAFRGCTSLTVIEIPEALDIDIATVFGEPEKLFIVKSLDIGYSLIKFYGSDTDVEIPGSITRIASDAFADSEITKIVIPDSVTSIGDGSFSNCKSLNIIYIPDDLALNEDLFKDCLSLYSIRTVDDNSVAIRKYWGTVNELDIPSVLDTKKVVSIDNGAFNGNTALKNISISADISYIDHKAFVDCTNADISYHEDTKTEKDSFINCKSVTVIKKPTPTPTSSPTKIPTATPEPTSTPTAKPTATTTPVPTATSVPTATPMATLEPTATPTPAGISKKRAIKNFVDRIYTFVLDREPEEEGALYWTNELYEFRRSGAEVAQGFIFSEEFENRKTDDETFIKILYKTFFGREADDDGMKFWLEQLKSGTMDRVTVANGFIFSQEWADTCATYGIRSGGETEPAVKIEPTEATIEFVERMYTTAMQREYDKGGRDYWANELSNFKVTGEQVGASFFLSDEMTGFNLSDAEFINRLYLTFMDRESDADGESFWLAFLKENPNRSLIVYCFTRSPEFTDKCIEARILPY